MSQKIRLTESEFQEMVYSTINEALQDEGFWNNLKTGAKTFVSSNNRGGGIAGRFQNAKKNYNLQGQYDNMGDLVNKLTQFVEAGQIDPQITVAQLIGGKMNGNKFGKMSSRMANMKSQMTKNGLKN